MHTMRISSSAAMLVMLALLPCVWAAASCEEADTAAMLQYRVPKASQGARAKAECECDWAAGDNVVACDPSVAATKLRSDYCYFQCCASEADCNCQWAVGNNFGPACSSSVAATKQTWDLCFWQCCTSEATCECGWADENTCDTSVAAATPQSDYCYWQCCDVTGAQAPESPASTPAPPPTSAPTPAPPPTPPPPTVTHVVITPDSLGWGFNSPKTTIVSDSPSLCELCLPTSLRASGTGKDVFNFLGAPLLGIKLSSIQTMTYWTKKTTPVGATAVDWFLQIYTSGGARIQAEPYLASQVTEQNGEWAQWQSAAGAASDTLPNSLNWGDSSGGDFGPNLGSWSDVLGNATLADQRVTQFTFATGGGWATGFEGLISTIEVGLSSGDKVVADFAESSA